MSIDTSVITRKADVKGRSQVRRSLLQETMRVRATAETLLTVLARRLEETRLHMWRVQGFALRLGQEIGLNPMQAADLEMGALLHDVGKIEVPLSILSKTGALTEEEWDRMRRHPVDGFAILKELSFGEGVALIAGQHHERWDGRGYPDGLKGDQIELTTRIFSVADAFDAITAQRVYKPIRVYDEAKHELTEGAGSQFDPQVVEAFLNVPAGEWSRIASAVADAVGAPGFSQAWCIGGLVRAA